MERRRSREWARCDDGTASTCCAHGETLRAIRAGRLVQKSKGGGKSIGGPRVYFYALDPAYSCCAQGETFRAIPAGRFVQEVKGGGKVPADRKYISMPWIQFQSAARDNVGEEYGRGVGTVADDRTVADDGTATKGDGTVSDDRTATVARMG